MARATPNKLAFCKRPHWTTSKKYEYVLTPGTTSGGRRTLDDGEPFDERIGAATAQLNERFAESARLEKVIRENFGESWVMSSVTESGTPRTGR